MKGEKTKAKINLPDNWGKMNFVERWHWLDERVQKIEEELADAGII